MKCTLHKQQYVGKADTPFNLRLNNHRNDEESHHPKIILACKHFQEKKHNFNISYTNLPTQKNLKKLCDNA